MNTYTKKLFITGGHLTPALAVIDEIHRRKLPWEIVFIGRTHTFEGSRETSNEQISVTKKGIRFISIETGRLQRALTLETFFSFIKIPYGFIQALIICLHEKPDAVVSFGGYIAFPVVIVSAIFHIPILTHEQTRVPGLANRIIALFAKKICISFPDIHHTFTPSKVIYTGLPVRKEIFVTPSKPAFDVSEKHYPIIYITGGTTGSVSLNTIVFPLISQLSKQYTIIHQTGKTSVVQALQIKHALPSSFRSRYIIQDYFDEKTIGWILRSASLVVCRSGANTIMELAILRKKAILIPLPWSGAGEQLANARWLQDVGLGYIITQNAASPTRVLEAINVMLKKPVDRVGKLGDIKRNGAQNVVDEIAGFVL